MKMWNLKKSLPVIVVLVALLIMPVGITGTAAASTTRKKSWYQPRPGDHTPLILAHQGGEGEYPSNSMLAFTKAHEANADALDTDVQVTKDGVLVLFHDDTLDARTNGSGPISEKTYAELLTLDFAYNWSPDGGATFPYRGKGIKVTTARELFTRFPHDRLGIEIKPNTMQAGQALCMLVRQFGAQDRVLVSSGGQAQMDAFRAACPRVATSATHDETVQFYTMHATGTIPSCYRPPFNSLQVPERSGDITLLTRAFIADAHQVGLNIYVWTIDTPEQAQRFIELGVDGINTSYPKRIIDWLQE